MRPLISLTALALLVAAQPGIARTVGPAEAMVAAQDGAQSTAGAASDDATARRRNPAFYKAEVTVASRNEKRRGLLRAFAQVVVRLTGDPGAASNPVIRRGMASVDDFVTQSDLRQESEKVNGVPVYRTVLDATFDPEAVDALIAGSGLKFWSSARPKPILWLAIDDGRGPRLVTGQQTNVVKPLATRGLERGLRYLLPAGNAAEQAAIRSIWSLNAAGMQVLTSRYRNDTQLLGKVYRKPPGWAADWLLTQDGKELARWSFEDANPQRVIASGVDEGVNALARRDARSLDTGTPGQFTVDVGGVDTQGDFVRLMGYLQTMPVVRKVSVVEAMPGQLRLQLDLSVGMKGFLTMLGTGQTLLPLATDAPVTGDVPRFQLQ